MLIIGAGGCNRDALLGAIRDMRLALSPDEPKRGLCWCLDYHTHLEVTSGEFYLLARYITCTVGSSNGFYQDTIHRKYGVELSPEQCFAGRQLWLDQIEYAIRHNEAWPETLPYPKDAI